MNFEEIEQKINKAMEPLIAFQALCEQVERDLPGDFYERTITNIRALQQALQPLKEEMARIGVLIELSPALSKAMINVPYAIEHLNEIVIQVVVLMKMSPLTVEALRKRRYVAGLISELLLEDIQATLLSLKKSVTPPAASYHRGNLSLVIVSEEKK